MSDKVVWKLYEEDVREMLQEEVFVGTGVVLTEQEMQMLISDIADTFGLGWYEEAVLIAYRNKFVREKLGLKGVSVNYGV